MKKFYGLEFINSYVLKVADNGSKSSDSLENFGMIIGNVLNNKLREFNNQIQYFEEKEDAANAIPAITKDLFNSDTNVFTSDEFPLFTDNVTIMDHENYMYEDEEEKEKYIVRITGKYVLGGKDEKDNGTIFTIVIKYFIFEQKMFKKGEELKNSNYDI